MRTEARGQAPRNLTRFYQSRIPIRVGILLIAIACVAGSAAALAGAFTSP
jgi:hypothetical protein